MSELLPLESEFEMYHLYFGQNYGPKYTDTQNLYLSTQPKMPSLALPGQNYRKIAGQFPQQEKKSVFDRVDLTKLVNESVVDAAAVKQNSEGISEIGSVKQIEQDTEKDRDDNTFPQDLTPEEFYSRLVETIMNNCDTYAEIADPVLEAEVQINTCTDIPSAFLILKDIIAKKLSPNDTEILLSKALKAGSVENNNVGDDKSEQDDRSPTAELFRQRRRLFNELVRPAFGNIQVKEHKLTEKKVRRYWFKYLNETRRNVKNKLESVLLSLRRSLLEKASLEKIGVKDLATLVGPMDTLERNYLVVALKKQALEYVDESIKAEATEVGPGLICIEDLINSEDGSFSEFLAKYIARPNDTKKVVDQEESKEQTKEDDSMANEPTEIEPEEHQQSDSKQEGQTSSTIPSLTSLQGKRPAKFLLNSEVMFCRDEINFDELTIGERKLVDSVVEEGPKIPPDIITAFKNLIPCSDEQVEYLLRMLYVKVDAAKTWKSNTETYFLYQNFCLSPSNEIKLIDAILFLLLNPNIYEKEDITASALLSKVAQNRLSLTQKKSEEVYKTFAENAIHFLRIFFEVIEPKIMYIPLDSIKSFTIKPIDELKTKYKYENKIDGMNSVLDLLILTAKVPLIAADKKLTQLLVEINKNFLEFAKDFKNKDYAFEVASRHVEYLFKQCGKDETIASFQGSFKAFIKIIPTILDSIVSSLKGKSQKIVEIVAKLKEIEKNKEGDKQTQLKFIEDAEEFKEISVMLVLLVSNFFNPLFRTSYLFWKSDEFKTLLDLDIFNLIKDTLKNVDEELQREESQMFILLVYEALEVYQRIAKKLNKLNANIMNLSGIKPLIEIAISLYAIAEMNTRLQKEVVFEKDSSPLPKLSKMISKEYTTEQPRKMQRSFTALKSEKSFDFDQIFANFGLNYISVLSNYFYRLSDGSQLGAIEGLVIFLTEKFPFIVSLDAKKKLIS